MTAVASILFATVFTFTVCLLTGKTLVRLARVTLFRSEELFLGFVLGSACLSALVFLLSVAGLARTWVFFVAGAGLIVAAWRYGAARLASKRFSALAPPFRLLFGAVYAVFAALYLVNALSPEASPDGAMFHVALPALYLREHRIPAITTNMLASFSEGVEMLYLFAFSFGRHSAAAMVHFVFTLLTAVGILSFGRRIGFPVAGVAGSLLFFASPIVGKLGSSAYLDVAVAGVVFAAFYLVEIWRESENDRVLVLVGILAGFAYAVKYTAFLTLAYVLGAIAARQWRLRKPFWRQCGVVSVAALTMVAPWVVKNTIVLRNPIAPLGNRIFSNPYLYASTERVYADSMASLHGRPLRTWPAEVTTRGLRLQGIVGPVFLLAPLAIAGVSTPPGRRLLCAAAIFLAPYPLAVATRFLVPSLPFLSLALGIALSRWKTLAFAVSLLHAALSWPTNMVKYSDPGVWRISRIDWRAALRITPEASFLEQRVDSYGIGRLLDAYVPRGDRVFSDTGFQQAYHTREVIVEWQSAFGVRLGECLHGPLDPDLRPARAYDFSFEPLNASRIRLIRNRFSEIEWGISELRVYRSGTELPRMPAWRLRASANPWDVQLAFDNNPLTRWSSRQPGRSSMFLEVDFGRPESIDRVGTECTRDQDATAMSLEWEKAPGLWESPAAHLTITEMATPPRLRRAAIETLKQNGVNWLVVHEDDLGARDFFTRQTQWGIRLVGTAPPYRLYKLE